MTLTSSPAGSTVSSLPGSPLRNWGAYRQIAHCRLRSLLTYRQNVFFLLAIVTIQIFILTKVWTALYDGAPVRNGIPLSAMLTYLTIANLQNWALQDIDVSLYYQSRVREGQVVFDMLRPVPFVSQMFAHLVGSSIGMAGFAVVALPFVALAGHLSAPASPGALAGWLVSLLLGYVVATLISIIIAMLSFWTTEVVGLTMLYQLVNQFLAGALVPIALFPGTLRRIAELLPFQATAYTPVSIYVGRLTGAAAGRAMAVQMLWVVLLTLMACLLWRSSQRKVFVQGG